MLKTYFRPIFIIRIRKMQKNVLKSQALGRDATPESVRQALFLYLQCSLPSALNSPVSSPTFSGFSSR